MSLYGTQAFDHSHSHQPRSTIRVRHSINNYAHHGPKVGRPRYCQSIADASILSASNDVFDAFAALANMFDDLDHQLDHIYTSLETLPIPSIWLQSPLFNWKQVSTARDQDDRFDVASTRSQNNMDKPDHRRFLRNFFAMSKIATLRQICQSMVDHSQLFESKRDALQR